MATQSKKLSTFNIKKDKRFQKKKKKLETLLDLVRNENIPVKRKQPESFNESYKALKEELKKYIKQPCTELKFSLANDGLFAKVSFDSGIVKFESRPLSIFIEDIYHLLLRSVIGCLSPFPTTWCKLNGPHNIAKTVVIVLDDFSKEDIIDNINVLDFILDTFSFGVSVISSNVPFATELCSLHLTSNFYLLAKEHFSSLFPIKETDTVTTSKEYKISKLHLLLSPIQLAMEGYPLPCDIFESSNCSDFSFTKDSYTYVTDNSPMFAVDCEMCQVSTGDLEVTRIAIVNENLEIIYHTLVKPEQKVENYLTKFSGITAEMLADVTITLKDVHENIKNILPSDAILCGQSLNCDLKALKLIHPYIIDTSVIYNEVGIRRQKPSLKLLSRTYLKETIQDSKKGHNPIEDSIATMKLVQLKLSKSVEFGDLLLTDSQSDQDCNPINNGDLCISDSKSDQDRNPIKNGDLCISDIKSNRINDNRRKPISKFSDCLNLQIDSKGINNGFFPRIAKFKKKACLIGLEESLNDYTPQLTVNFANIIHKSNTKKIIKAFNTAMESYDLIITHLPFKQEKNFKDLNEAFKLMYETCLENTLFSILVPGYDNTKEQPFKKGLFFTVIKK